MTLHRDNLRINNQKDASSIQKFYFVTKLHVSDIFCAHHQELSAVHAAIGMFHAGYVVAVWQRPHNLHNSRIFLKQCKAQYSFYDKYQNPINITSST
jgi:hypothetical protein